MTRFGPARKETDEIPLIGLKYHIGGESEFDTLLLWMRNLAPFVDPVDDRMPNTKDPYEAVDN
jgi:hypothetical protein